jgi:hypothetical protein
MMAAPQDWAPYYGIEDAAKVYLRDPLVALDQLRGVVDFPSIQSFFMTRRLTEESWGEALSQEVVATDGRRLIMWRADDDMSVGEEHQRQVLNASVRTILLSTITDHIDARVRGSRRRHPSAVGGEAADVHPTHHAQSREERHDTDFFCESFRHDKSVDNGGLAQMERLLQFGGVLSRSM